MGTSSCLATAMALACAVAGWPEAALAEEAGAGESGVVDPVSGPTLSGQRGLLRAAATHPYETGSVVLGSSFEFSSTSDFLAPGDSNQRVASKFALAWVPWQTLELAAGFSMVMNGNSSFSPEDTVNVGDPYLSVRYGHDLSDTFSVGGGIEWILPNGAGTFVLVPEASILSIGASFDARLTPDLLLALNLAYRIDNSAQLFDHRLNPAQQFSAGINPHDQLRVLLGAGYSFDFVAPFLELGLAPAIGSEGGFGDNPTWLTLGARAWPLDHKTLTALLAFDIGLTGVKGVPAGQARIPRWNLILGLAYDFGAQPSGETKIVEKIVEVPVEGAAGVVPSVAGKVVDARTGAPLPGARVVLDGAARGIVITDPEDGSFGACAAKTGMVKVTAHLDGYASNEQAVVVQSGPAEVVVKLEPSQGPTFGRLRGTVRSLTEGVLQATVSVPTRKLKLDVDERGRFEHELETGTFDVLISYKGHVTQRRKINLRAGEEIVLNVELYPRK